MNAPTIIKALGGIKPTAQLAGCTVQAVYQWQASGTIPKRSLDLLRAKKPRVFKALAEAQEGAQS
jgi:hypothetical protein